MLLLFHGGISVYDLYFLKGGDVTDRPLQGCVAVMLECDALADEVHADRAHPLQCRQLLLQFRRTCRAMQIADPDDLLHTALRTFI